MPTVPFPPYTSHMNLQETAHTFQLEESDQLHPTTPSDV
jgi:hypothetical protein